MTLIPANLEEQANTFNDDMKLLMGIVNKYFAGAMILLNEDVTSIEGKSLRISPLIEDTKIEIVERKAEQKLGVLYIEEKEVTNAEEIEEPDKT